MLSQRWRPTSGSTAGCGGPVSSRCCGRQEASNRTASMHSSGSSEMLRHGRSLVAHPRDLRFRSWHRRRCRHNKAGSLEGPACPPRAAFPPATTSTMSPAYVWPRLRAVDRGHADHALWRDRVAREYRPGGIVRTSRRSAGSSPHRARSVSNPQVFTRSLNSVNCSHTSDLCREE